MAFFKRIFANESYYNEIPISPPFVPNGPIESIGSGNGIVQVTAWRLKNAQAFN